VDFHVGQGCSAGWVGELVSLLLLGYGSEIILF